MRRNLQSELEPPLSLPTGHAEQDSISNLEGITVRGELTAVDPLSISGVVEGSISSSGAVMIIEGGEVSGPISAPSVTIAGSVTGDVVATNGVKILSTGYLIGNVTTARIILEEGAYFKGNIDLRELATDRLLDAAWPEADAAELSAEMDIQEGRYEVLETIEEIEAYFMGIGNQSSPSSMALDKANRHA